MSRDDFSVSTKRTLAQRAGGRCSFPGRDKLCCPPGEGPTKAASVGVAAHICAASNDGPRQSGLEKTQNIQKIKSKFPYLISDIVNMSNLT